MAEIAKVKTELQGKTNSELITSAGTVHTALSGNPNFTIDPLKLAALKTNTAAMNILNMAKILADEAAIQATTELNISKKVVEGNITELALTCNSQTTEAVKLQTTGMEVYYPGRGEAVVLTQVQNFSASEGDNSGEIDLSYDGVKGAQGYGFQKSQDPNDPSKWVNLEGVGKITKTTITGLTSGDKYWFRVRALKGNEKGPWSDPATKAAP